MQTIKNILSVRGNKGSWCTVDARKIEAPELALGLRARLRIDLRTTAEGPDGYLESMESSDVASDAYYIAFDADFLPSTAPKLIRTTGIALATEAVETVDSSGEPLSLTRLYLDAEIPNTAVPELAALFESGKESLTLNGEIGGYSGTNGAECADFVIQFPVTIRNRVYMGGDAPPDAENDPEYLTAVQVQALINAAIENATRAPAASLSIGSVTTGETASVSITGTPPAQLLNLILQRGAPGASGEPGAAGRDGAPGAPGADGSDGRDLAWDEAGLVSERDVYSDREAGFRFAATVTDASASSTTLYIWRKRSADNNDWTEPLAITYYSRAGTDGANARLIEPLEFSAPAQSAEYLSLDLSSHEAASICAVCIDTSEGELRLPYYSALGIRKIVRNTTTNVVRIYFGSQVPAYTTGRIYFAQGYVTGSGSGGDPSGGGGDGGEWDNLVDPGNYSDDLTTIG